MALWRQLQQLDSRFLDKVDQLYDGTFPMEVRQYLSQWIESHDWDDVAANESLATLVFYELLTKLDEHYSHLNLGNNLLLQHNIRKIKRNLLERFQPYPEHMAMIISTCLKQERNILEMAIKSQETAETSQSSLTMEKQNQVDKQVDNLKKCVQDTEQNIQVLEDQQNEYILKKNQMEAANTAQSARDVQREKLMIREIFTRLNKIKEVVVHELFSSLKLVEQIQSTLISVELPDWKRRQQMACIGAPPNACLDQLQNWFTAVAECLQQTRQQLNKLQELVLKFSYDNDPISLAMSSLQEQALTFFENLLLNSLVVEGQPCMPTHPQRPLVLKTGGQFTVKLRLLVNLPELNCQLNVNVSFDKDVTENNTVKGCRRFNLLGKTTKVMKTEESSGLTAQFLHLQLKEQKAPRSRSESPLFVTEELHTIVFETQLSLPGLCIDLKATSLPVVVISGIAQLSSAWASILWYNMFCTDCQNLSFFLSPPPMKWGELANVLSWQFSSVTKRGLSADQLSTLADKLLGPETNCDPEALVTWSKFNKPASEKGNSFWLWIDAILDLVKRYLLNIWNDGYIMGFVNREKAKALLRDKPQGTFLLRFSETCKEGGITITWVGHSQEGRHLTHSVLPYTKHDLVNESFPDIIRNYTLMAAENVPEHPLLYLYPDIPKDAAFSCYYSTPPEASANMELDEQRDRYMPRQNISVTVLPGARFGTGCFL
ncbi:signal transducer and activator of transcription 1-alpha/beta-like isoform X2 [Hoplias malabaricus]|uniref:signal transducer and activator of transcription 1-alpha/beta-like isoform X2 n=1 Tax=Hoplias malabaricus TaxID=27720 RepID=UPI0034625539